MRLWITCKHFAESFFDHCFRADWNAEKMNRYVATLRRHVHFVLLFYILLFRGRIRIFIFSRFFIIFFYVWLEFLVSGKTLKIAGNVALSWFIRDVELEGKKKRWKWRYLFFYLRLECVFMQFKIYRIPFP